MGRDNHEFVVDGIKYVSSMYTPTKGWELFARLAKAVGPAAANGLDSLSEDAVAAGMKMIGSVFTNLKPEDVVPLLKDIMSTTSIQDDNAIRKIIFDNDFRGKYVHALNVAKEIVEFQFEDFWNAIKGMLGDNPLVAAKK